MCSPDATYGSAGWAAGFSNEEAANPFSESEVAAADAGYTVFQKAAFFAVIIAAIGIYLRLSRSKTERSDVGYEKTLA